MMKKLIKVQVKAGGKKNEVVEVDKETLAVEVRAKPYRGEANEAVRFLIAGHFKLPLTKVRIVSGRLSPHKVMEIMD